jgi:transposase InsO family protein
MKALCERFKIDLRHGKPYTPKTQGAVERFNQTIKNSIMAHMTQNDNNKYLEALPSLVYNYNCQKHLTTKFTPFQVLFHRDQSVDPLTKLVKENISKNADKMVIDSIKKNKAVKDHC